METNWRAHADDHAPLFSQSTDPDLVPSSCRADTDTIRSTRSEPCTHIQTLISSGINLYRQVGKNQGRDVMGRNRQRQCQTIGKRRCNRPKSAHVIDVIGVIEHLQSLYCREITGREPVLPLHLLHRLHFPLHFTKTAKNRNTESNNIHYIYYIYNINIIIKGVIPPETRAVFFRFAEVLGDDGR